ncbi:MAG: AMP-binding protein [Candidatus Lambdaproteobacteria bacterium]|nr:AMP-binding protein [Candidatus Lambdaproteobacteria bacterium]
MDANPLHDPLARPPEADVQALLGLIRGLVVEMHPHRHNSADVRLDSSLEKDLGFDSLGRVELMLRIEQHFGVGLPDHVLAAAQTPSELLRALARAQTAGDGVRGDGAAVPMAPGETEPIPSRAATLHEVLDWHVQAHPDRPHIYLYGDDDTGQTLTYAELLRGAQAIAGGLHAHGLLPGQPVAIMLVTSREYFFSFFGILLAGGVPVPIYPPARLATIEDHLRRHVGILNNAGVPILITIPEAKPLARLLGMQVETLRLVETPEALMATGAAVPRLVARPDDLAFLQYTSGSTGSPKGVMLTHANLLANIHAMVQVAGVDSTDVFVSWLPLYHDMGLIGAWMGSLYTASLLVLMSPLHFLARPERWLRAIDRHRGTLSPGVNFAYELCVRSIDEAAAADLKLDSWRLAFNGAEPVSPETLARFRQRFAPCGFRAEAMTPVYGLAECSLGLAFPPVGRGPLIDHIQREPFLAEGRALPAEPGDAAALRFVACGRPLPGHQIRIVDEAGRELGDREEGRLEFKGPSTTSGYYRNAEATRALFNGEWLNSGDQAYLAAGEVVITGRVKDVIIRAGRNLYPYELEEAIGAIAGIRKGCVAVFASRDRRSGTENVVVLAETRETGAAAHERLLLEIERTAVELVGAVPDEIVLAPPHSVLKTSSGKIRRAACRELYEKGELSAGQRAVWLQVLRLFIAGMRPELRRWRRRVTSLIYGVWSWAVFAVVAPLGWLAGVLTPGRRPAWAAARVCARLLLACAGARWSVQGIPHLPRGRGAVLIANHSSYLDSLLLFAALPEPFSFVAKRELLGSFVARTFLRRQETVFVERFDTRQSIEDARAVAEAVRQGGTLLVFPEGTFSRMPGLLSFHLGAFSAACEAGAPVVPITLRGTRSMLRDGQWLPRRARLSVTIAPPIPPAGDDFKAAVRLRDAARAEILRRCGEPDLAGEDPHG